MHIFVLIICGQILLPGVEWWAPPPGRSFSEANGAPCRGIHGLRLVENKGKAEERKNWSLGRHWVSPALSLSSWLIHRFILYILILGWGTWQHRKHQDTRKGASPSPTHEMQRSRANRQQQRTTGRDREQMTFNVGRKHGVIHQLTRQIPDRMLSNAPGANYWLPMTNWVCILNIFAQTMEVITDCSTALPRKVGRSCERQVPRN